MRIYNLHILSYIAIIDLKKALIDYQAKVLCNASELSRTFCFVVPFL